VSTEQWFFIFAAIGAVIGILEFFGIGHWVRSKFRMENIFAIGWTRREKVMAFFLLLSLIFAIFGYFKSTNKELSYFGTYGGLNPHERGFIGAEVRGDLLFDYRNKFKVAVVAYKWDGLIDINDAPNLQKSNLFDITNNREIRIKIKMNEEFVDELRKGHLMTNYSILLVPNGVTMDQFTTLRQAKALGIKVMETRGGPP
jgi:hypothetical protein